MLGSCFFVDFAFDFALFNFFCFFGGVGGSSGLGEDSLEPASDFGSGLGSTG